MSGFSGRPRIIKGGIVLLDPDSGAMLRLIALQYNPDTLTRSLTAQSVAGDGQNRSEPLRLKGSAGRDVQAGGRARRHRPARIS